MTTLQMIEFALAIVAFGSVFMMAATYFLLSESAKGRILALLVMIAAAGGLMLSARYPSYIHHVNIEQQNAQNR